MAAPQTHLCRVIPWRGTRIPRGVLASRKTSKRIPPQQVDRQTLLHRTCWGGDRIIFLISPTMRLGVDKTQPPERGHHGGTGAGCQAHPGKGESDFS